jgi:hypothetical protein
MSDGQTPGAGVEGTGEAGGGTGDSKAGTQAQESGGQSLLSQAFGAGKGAEDKAGDSKDGEVKDGAPKDGEQDKKPDTQSAEAKPLTSADFADVIPEGKVWDDELGKSFLDIVNDGKLSRADVSKKLLTLYSEQQDKMLAGEQAAQTATREKYLAEIAGWEKAAKADKEFGGQKWDASQPVIARGGQHLATPEATALFNEHYLGSHPEVLRMFYRAGLLLGEDEGLANGGSTGGKPDIATAIFGESVRNLKKHND